MPVFDAYLTVDWSAKSTPARGADSIWYALHARSLDDVPLCVLENVATRAEAEDRLVDLLARLSAEGWRTLAGFDFPFGYPAGTAARLGLGAQAGWRETWDLIADLLEDGDDNRNNRFAVGDGLNQRMGGEPFPFWGHPNGERWPHLVARGRRPHGPGDLPERRLCEQRVRKAQPVWKLAYTGSVGGQALTGIPRLRALRRHPALEARTRIWPFETGLAPLTRPDEASWRVVLAEIYPSLVKPVEIPDKPKDAGQVVAIGRFLARLDDEGRLGAVFGGDPSLSAADRMAVEREEAWILGVAERAPSRDPEPPGTGAAMPRPIPQALAASGVLDRVAHEALAMAVTLAEATGDPELPRWLTHGPGAVGRIAVALSEGAALVSDHQGLTAWANGVVPGTVRFEPTLGGSASVSGALVVAAGSAAALRGLTQADGDPPAGVMLFSVGFDHVAELKRMVSARFLKQDVPVIALGGTRGGLGPAVAALRYLIEQGRREEEG